MSLARRVHQVLKANIERTVMAMVVLALALALALAVIRRPVAELAVHVAPGIVMVRAHGGVLRNLIESGKPGRRHRYQGQSVEETVCPDVYSHQTMVSFSTSPPREREKKTRRRDGGVNWKAV